ncbi:MAG: glutathione peroxidase [Bacteroidales bacterium]|nr:glutathione peroxidase [Bacteroidales bacterium]
MKTKLSIIALMTAIMSFCNVAGAQSIYDFKVKDMGGNDVSLSEYKGKVLLIVNTATKCGFTPQYEELQALYEKYKDKGLVILDFPCNQFGGQAPGEIAEIHDFCTSKYNTTFPQFDKVDVNGENESPLFAYLKSKQGFKGFGNGTQAKFMDEMMKKNDPDYASKPDVKWNFTKFLVDSKGEVVARFEPTVSMNFVSTVVSSKLF